MWRMPVPVLMRLLILIISCHADSRVFEKTENSKEEIKADLSKIKISVGTRFRDEIERGFKGLI